MLWSMFAEGVAVRKIKEKLRGLKKNECVEKKITCIVEEEEMKEKVEKRQ